MDTEEFRRIADTTLGFSRDTAALISGTESGLSAEDLDAIAALPPESALLIALRGPNVGARFLLDTNTTTAGRHPDADIFLDDVTVSRRHAQFLRDGAVFTVRDLGSLNGTYLNGERLDESTLAEGDEVQIGKYRLTFYTSRHGDSA